MICHESLRNLYEFFIAKKFTDLTAQDDVTMMSSWCHYDVISIPVKTVPLKMRRLTLLDCSVVSLLSFIGPLNRPFKENDRIGGTLESPPTQKF